MALADFPWSSISAGLSAVAAVAAAFATWRAPRSAALIAERLRRETEADLRRRVAKQDVFAAIMAGRARIDAPDVAAALNSIDYVFSDCRSVRDRWAELVDALSRAVESEVRPAIRSLLSAMAQDLGISANIRSSDLDRVYYPRSIEFDRLARQIMNEKIIAEAQGRGSQAANASRPYGPFPPPPS